MGRNFVESAAELMAVLGGRKLQIGRALYGPLELETAPEKVRVDENAEISSGMGAPRRL